MKKIRWGILGYARIASENVIPAMQRASNAEFHAIASRDERKLAECRARYKVPGTFSGYEALLKDPEVDAVYIPLPNALHCEWTIKAAEHGKHVLCEKPLALNAAECRRMISAAAANKVTLMEAFMYRYTDRTRKVLEIVRSGVLGEIKFVSSCFRFLLANPDSIKFKPELGGGSLYDVGCYPINFTGMIMDEIARTQSNQPGVSAAAPETVSAQFVHVNGVDVIASVILKYRSGLVASLNSGFNAQKRVFSEIVGTKGVLEIPETFFDNAGALILTVGEEKREIPVGQCERYRLEVEDFGDAVLTGRKPLLALEETLRNAVLMDRLLAAGG